MEVAGLTIGVAALFSTCVEAFDIVVSAKDASREYEELSTEVRRLSYNYINVG